MSMAYSVIFIRSHRFDVAGEHGGAEQQAAHRQRRLAGVERPQFSGFDSFAENHAHPLKHLLVLFVVRFAGRTRETRRALG